MTEESTLDTREERTSLAGQVRYDYDDQQSGLAFWVNVSRTGASVRMGRYLRPNRMIALLATDPVEVDQAVPVAARVVWCRPIGDGSQFLVGLRMLRQCPEEALAASRWLRQAREQASLRASQMNETTMETVDTSVWPGFRVHTARQTHTAKAV